MIIAFAAALLAFLLMLEAAFPFGFFLSFGVPVSIATMGAAFLELPRSPAALAALLSGLVFYWIWRRRRALMRRSDQGSFWRGKQGLAVTDIAAGSGTLLLGSTLWPARLAPDTFADHRMAISAGDRVQVADCRDGCLLVTPLPH